MSKNSDDLRRQMSLQDRILQVDHIQAKRFGKLMGDSLEIAFTGIIRHLRACSNLDCNPDASAIREIIDDALNGKQIYDDDDNLNFWP